MADEAPLGGMLGGEDEAVAEVDTQLGGLDAAAAALAMQAAAAGRLPPEAAEYFRIQSRLVAIQGEHLHEQRALTLSHLRLRRVGDWFRTVTQFLILLVAVAVVAYLAAMVSDAMRSKSVIVDLFKTPPSLAARGLTGEVVAAALSDQLAIMQAATHTTIAARSLANTWSDKITVEIPETGINLIDLDRFLKSRFSNDTIISGDLVQTDSGGLDLTIRGTGVLAKTFSGSVADLPKLIKQAAEYAYGQSQPALYAFYLGDVGRTDEAVAMLQASYDSAPAEQHPFMLVAWGNALGVGWDKDGPRSFAAVENEVAKLYRAAISLKPDYWAAYDNLALTLAALGNEEGAWKAGEAMRDAAGGRPGRAPEIRYGAWDLLTHNIQAYRHAAIVDVDTQGGHGMTYYPEGLDIALDDVVLHDPASAELRLATTQTSAAPDTETWVAQYRNFISAKIAEERGDKRAAISQAEAATPDMAASNNCWLAQVEEEAGNHDKADAALKKGGHFVDCYRFHADFLDERGDWPAAQRAYADAVALAPDLPAAYYSWGVALARHNDLAGAIEKLAAANQRGPHWADPLKAWGDVLASQGKWRAALAKYDEALRYAPAWDVLKHARSAAAQKI